MVLDKAVNRQGIFFFYDKEGIVDEYIIYYLENMIPYFKNILVVCNGKLMPEGRKKLEELDKITVLVRENKGFDVWAYKTGIEYLGWEQLQNSVDELIMFNFTIMGPVDSFEDMFCEMNQCDVDFWGVTIHNGAPFDPWNVMKEGEIPVHIQSHFIAVRKKMLSSFEFQQYWEQMPMIRRYEEAVGLHEAVFTKHFEECGYTWSVYVDTEDLLKETFYPMFNMPIDLIKNRKCPFFKRKLFIHDWNSSVDENGFHAAAELFWYLKTETHYDTDMIVKHLMRSGNLRSFIDGINSRFIVSLESEHEGKLTAESAEKIAFVIFINEKSHGYLEDYLKYIPKAAHCYIMAPSESFLDKARKAGGITNSTFVETKSDDQESEWLSLVGEIYGSYEYICKMKDIGGEHFQVLTNIRSFAKLSYDCMMKSEGYIARILKLFENNCRLGMLFPVSPVHSDYFGLIGNEWGGRENYDVVCELLEDIDCEVPLSYDIRPVISLSGCMWIRTDALKGVFSLAEKKKIADINGGSERKEKGSVSDLFGELCEITNYIWAYIGQKNGYYTSYVCPEMIATNTMVNENNAIAKINSDMQNKDALHTFLFNMAADFTTIDVNFDTGAGYLHKNLVSKVVIRRKYSTENVAVRYTVLPGSKEIIINIASGLMCMCKGVRFEFFDKEDHLIKLRYRTISNADCRQGANIDVFYNCKSEYCLKGDFSEVHAMVISIEQLIVVPFMQGVGQSGIIRRFIKKG